MKSALVVINSEANNRPDKVFWVSKGANVFILKSESNVGVKNVLAIDVTVRGVWIKEALTAFLWGKCAATSD